MGRRQEIYVSPDGGETVYVQKKDGTRGRMVSQSQTAKDEELMYEESDMVGIEAIKLRSGSSIVTQNDKIGNIINKTKMFHEEELISYI